MAGRTFGAVLGRTVPGGAALAAALVLAVAAGPAAADEGLPAAYACTGNEPFWSLEIMGQNGTWSRLTGAGIEETPMTGQAGPLAYLDPRVLVWRGTGDALAGDIVAVITEQTCLDTMADVPPFAFRAVVSTPAGEALAGCCRTPAAEPVTAADLAGTAWLAEEIDGLDVIDSVQSTLVFEDAEQVVGNAGCNRYFGMAEIEGGLMHLGPLGATRMSCVPAVDEQEQRFLTALGRTHSFALDGGTLVLFDTAGTPVLRLSPLEER